MGSSELELGEPAQPNGEETCDKMGREEKGPPTEHNKRSSSSAVVETTPSGGFHAELIGLTGGCYFCDANVPQAPDKDKSTKEAFSICDSFDYDMNNDKFWEEAFILD